MSGSFTFSATRVGATGTYPQSTVTFVNLPAVQITIVQ
jgi:hypothetical protein